MFISIERKLLFSLFAIGILMLTLGGLFLATTRSQAMASEQVIQARNYSEKISRLFSDLQDLEVGQRGFLLTDRREYLEPYTAARARILDDLKQVRELTTVSRFQTNRINLLEELVTRKMGEVDRTLDLREQSGVEAAKAFLMTDQGKRTMDAIRKEIAEIRSEQTLFLESQWWRYRLFVQTTTVVAIVGPIGVVFLLVFSGRTMRRKFAKLDAANRKLLENDRWLKLALSAGNAGMWSWDPESDTVLWSDEHYLLYGRNPCTEQFTFGDWMNMVLASDRLAVEATLRKAVSEVGETNHEFRILQPDGTVKWVFLRGQSLCEGSDRHVQVAGISGDISALKKSQESLVESESRFRQLESHIEDVFWILDYKTGQVQYISPVYEKLWGLSVETVYENPNTWWDRIHPDDRDWVLTDFAEKSGTTGVDQEYRVVLDGDVVKWARGRSFVVRDDQGEPVRIVGITEDITARKEIEREREDLLWAERQARFLAEQAEARFRTLTETIPSIVWTSEPDGSTSYHNVQWQQYTGLPPEESLGWGWKSVIHPDDLEETLARWTESLSTGVTFEAEFRLRRHDNIFRWFLARGVPITDEAGVIQMWIGTCTDIHEQKRAQEIRARLLDLERQARDEAEAANRSKDEFVALVSHELRSPLNAMLGWARILNATQVDPAMVTKAVRIIEQSANTQLRLVEDLLDTARIISGKLKLELDQMSLCDVTTAALETLRPSAEAKEIEVSFTADADLGNFYGDPDRIQQVVWNLMSNAIKFTPSGGRIEVAIQKCGKGVRLMVKDTGRGIATEILPFIFDRFNQGNAPGSRRKTGLGLGLSLARYIVELHGGTIQAESEGDGQGATFIVDFPLPEIRRNLRITGGMEAVTLESPLPPARENGGIPSARLRFNPTLNGLSILTLDDEEPVRDLVSTLLRNFGAQVTVCSNVGEAMRWLTSEDRHFDAIVSDIGMPDEDGYEFMRQVRALPNSGAGRVPALALTAYGSTNDRIRVLEAGFQMHLSKPVEPLELMMAVASLCGRPITSLVTAGPFHHPSEGDTD